jgi:hypothetical protein
MAEAATDRAADIMIRPAAAGDLPTLPALYRHLNHDDPDMDSRLARDRFAAILAHPGMTIFDGPQGAGDTALLRQLRFFTGQDRIPDPAPCCRLTPLPEPILPARW